MNSSTTTLANSQDPWSRPRLLLGQITTALRLSLAGQVLLGQELSNLKKDLGYQGAGGDRRSNGHSVHLISWPTLIQENLGISYKTADRMIDCYEAAKTRLKKLTATATLPNGSAHLETLFTTRPGELTEAQCQELAKCVDKLVDGSSQTELLQELKITKFHVSLEGGDTSAHNKQRPSEEEMMAQLSFRFFHPVAEALQAFRRNSDRDAFLHTLALHSGDAEEITLTTLETDLTATLAAVTAAKKARMKPTTGKVISEL
jgi:hypothetical protein